MGTALIVLHALSAVVILAEALNKIERTDPLAAGISARHRGAEWLKALAWALLALGAGGGIAGPLMGQPPPTLADTCVALGFAVLIVRTRIKEG